MRVWANDLLLRIDVAYSSEGIGVQMMIEHPFRKAGLERWQRIT